MRGRLAATADGVGASQTGDMLPLRHHRIGEGGDAFDRDASGVRDVRGGFTRADARLNVAWSQGTVHTSVSESTGVRTLRAPDTDPWVSYQVTYLACAAAW